jgi:hypothetical protein
MIRRSYHPSPSSLRSSAARMLIEEWEVRAVTKPARFTHPRRRGKQKKKEEEATGAKRVKERKSAYKRVGRRVGRAEYFSDAPRAVLRPTHIFHAGALNSPSPLPLPTPLRPPPRPRARSTLQHDTHDATAYLSTPPRAPPTPRAPATHHLPSFRPLPHSSTLRSSTSDDACLWK